MNKSSVSCPVPTEQQPVNEYEQLKTAWLFSDCTASVRKYTIRIAWIFGLSWLIAGPLSAASFPPHKYMQEFILSASAGASIGVVLVLVRLYLGWSYVRDRLKSPVIFYEESGWYDGQTWTKPLELLTRDRLIVTYQIEPIMRRLQLTFALMLVLYIAGTIVWQMI